MIKLNNLDKGLIDVLNDELELVSGSGFFDSLTLQPAVSATPQATSVGLGVGIPGTTTSVSFDRTFNASGGVNTLSAKTDLAPNLTAGGGVNLSNGNTAAGLQYSNNGVSVGVGAGPGGLSSNFGLSLKF